MTSNKETQSALLKAAFHRFVELVESIEDVYAVAAEEPLRPDFYTFISRMDTEVMHRVREAEQVLDKEYEDRLLIEFHTRFIDGRPPDGLLNGADFKWVKKARSKREAERGVAG